MPQVPPRTLLFGSSIIKDVNPKGLQDHVHVRTNRGARIDDITQKLADIDNQTYTYIIIYIGGNDVSDTSTSDFGRMYEHMVESALQK